MDRKRFMPLNVRRSAGIVNLMTIGHSRVACLRVGGSSPSTADRPCGETVTGPFCGPCTRPARDPGRQGNPRRCTRGSALVPQTSLVKQLHTHTIVTEHQGHTLNSGRHDKVNHHPRPEEPMRRWVWG